MATYRLSAQVIGRSSGRTATAAAAYRAACRIEDARTGLLHDYTRKRGVVHEEILAPPNAPDWMRERAQLWNAVEAAEKRKDAQLCRELLLSLPHELDDAQRLELVRSFVRDDCVSRGMVADVTLHRPDREGDHRNHHAHVLLTMRVLTGDGFGAKARDWNDAAVIERWREQWAVCQNRALERAGRPERVDHRSHEARGSDHEPEPKQGPVATEMERRGKRSKAGDARRAAQDTNKRRDAIKQEAEVIDLELARIERDERRQAAEARAKLAKIEAKKQAQARAAIRMAAIRLRELKEQRQGMQARHDAAYAGRRDEWRRFQQERDEGRKALFDRFQHAIDQVWKPERGPQETRPDFSPWQKINERLHRNRADFDRREASAWGRVRNALDAVDRWPGAAKMIRLILNFDARRQGFERQQRKLYARLAPKGQARPPQARPTIPTPKRGQSDRLKEMRREALAEYDRETKAAAAAMQGRHQFQRQAEAAEKTAMRQAQTEAGERMDAAKAAGQEGAGPPASARIESGAENRAVEIGGDGRGHYLTETRQRPFSGHQTGKAALSREARATRPGESRTTSQSPDPTRAGPKQATLSPKNSAVRPGLIRLHPRFRG